LVEKIITLENVSLVDFLGVDNQNVKAVTDSFPKTKIVSRGNEIRIQGSGAEILRVNELFNSLLNHYNKFGKVTSHNVQTYIEQGNVAVEIGQEDALLFGTKGAPIRSKSTNQKKFVDTVKKHDVVFAVGPAGTGKTYIAVALAVRALKNKEIKRIIITRPAVEAGENLGFLPGELQEKIDPYLRPIYDALDDMIPSEKLKYYRENRVIEIAPLAYMRGRTLNNAFILLDEAQNTTPMQIKMFLTRLGKNSKLIINGDRTQIDLKPNQKSGLDDAIQILNNVRGIGLVELNEKDVIRHPIVKEIIKAYDKFHG
jgi:phosphate starvation-inducible PhoH-like protein